MDRNANHEEAPQEVEHSDELQPLLGSIQAQSSPDLDYTMLLTQWRIACFPLELCTSYAVDKVYGFLPSALKAACLLVLVLIGADFRSKYYMRFISAHIVVVAPLFKPLFSQRGGCFFFMAYIGLIQDCLSYCLLPGILIYPLILVVQSPRAVTVSGREALSSQFQTYYRISKLFPDYITQLPSLNTWISLTLGLLLSQRTNFKNLCTIWLQNPERRAYFISILGITVLLFLVVSITWLRKRLMMAPVIGRQVTYDFSYRTSSNTSSMLLRITVLRHYISKHAARCTSALLLQSRKTFKYSDLQKDQSEIRILKLYPGRLLCPTVVHCDLISMALHEVGEYEAISHRWINDAPTLISVNNQKTSVPLSIYTMLRSLQLSDRPRFIWIDSLCINQKNDIEKSWQVQMMGQIFRNAVQVVAWLGDEPTYSGALTTLANSSSKSSESGLLEDHEDLLDEDFQKIIQRGYQDRWRAVAELFRNDWFSRVWIIQEIALAKQITVRVGKYEEMDWNRFHALAAIFRLRGFIPYITSHFGLTHSEQSHEAETGINHLIQMQEIRQSILDNPEGMSLLSAVAMVSRFNSTVFEDRFYGMLGMLDVQGQDAIKVNYEVTSEEVVLQVSRYLHFESPGPENSFTEAGTGWSGDTDRYGPSWGIDGLSRCPVYHNTYHTANHLEFDIEELFGFDKAVLSVRGSTLEKIESVSSLWCLTERNFHGEEFSLAEDQLLALLNEGMEFATKALVKHAELSAEEILWKTTFLKVAPEKGQIPQPFLPLDVFHNVYSALKERCQVKHRYNGATEYSEAEQAYLNGISWITSMAGLDDGARLCITTGGYLGFVPSETQVDDTIFIIHGSRVPVVLTRHEPTNRHSSLAASSIAGDDNDSDRQSTTSMDQSEKFGRLVGACYVEGIMQGELKDADLPFERILLY